jgi:hypothetical protein
MRSYIATRETAGAAATNKPEPSFPHAAAGSCTKVLSSQHLGNSTTAVLA